MFDQIGLYASQTLLILIALFSIFKDWEDFKGAKTGRLTPVAVLVFTFLAGFLALQQTHLQIRKEQKGSVEAEAQAKKITNLEEDNKILQSKLDFASDTLRATGLDVKVIRDTIAVQWLKTLRDRTQEGKDRRKAARENIVRLIGLSEGYSHYCSLVGPPRSGGTHAEDCLYYVRSWLSEVKGYADGSLGESNKRRLCNAPHRFRQSGPRF